MKVAPRLLFLPIASALVLAGCAHLFTLARKDIPIMLQVTGSPSGLKVTTPGNTKCKTTNRNKNGCIYVAKNDTARIRFRLNASPNWFFTRFKICKGDVKAEQVCDLDIWERIEFIATTDSEATLLVPGTNGEVDLTALPESNIDEFILYDLNLVEQDYFYSIQVCNTDVTVDCLWTDPPLENKGKGNSP